MTLFWNEPFQNQKCRKNVNDHYAETANDITFKLDLLTTLLSDNITAKFHYFAWKQKKSYIEDKKTHKFPKNGPKNRPQVTPSNYIMTPCLIQVISNNGIGEESPWKMVKYDFRIGENLASPLIKSWFCFHSDKIGLKQIIKTW